MALITYDISMKHVEVKAAMLKLGYLDRWTSDGKYYFLPNTTLWKNGATVEVALKDLQSVVTLLRVPLERAIAVPEAPWAGIPGAPHP